jgi:hypothetical protein
MAILTHGPLGTFSGRIGNIVGSTWKGKQVIRQIQTTRRTNFSELQIQQQIRFSLIMKLLQPLAALLKQSFSQDPARMTRNNKAFSINYRRAITGTWPDFKIDYSLVVLGRGKLSRAAMSSCSSPSAGLIECKWTNFSHQGNFSMNDKAWFVSYCERLNHWNVQLAIADRGAGFCVSQDPELSGESLHVYLGFISADGRQSSDSMYAGLVKVA